MISLIGSANALTDQELTNKYRGSTDADTLTNIQNAINDHSLNCSDLPSDILAQGCPNTPTTSTIVTSPAGSNTYTQTNPSSQDVSPAPIPIPTIDTATKNDSSGNFIFALIPIIIVLAFMLLRGLLLRDHSDDYEDTSDRPKQPSKLLRYSPFHKKVVRHTSQTDNIPDLTSLDNSISEHDYSNKGMFDDAEVNRVRDRLRNHQRKRSLPTSHKFLFSIGLMKEKKK